jgi:hypothetical protein
MAASPRSERAPKISAGAEAGLALRPSARRHESFAAAFTRGTVLDTSVASTPIGAAAAIRAFFEATRAMYDEIVLVHETRSGTRTHLEWEGKFAGQAIAGTTILSRNAEGEIRSSRLYHRSYEQVVAFSAELARRLVGKVDALTFANR